MASQNRHWMITVFDKRETEKNVKEANKWLSEVVPRHEIEVTFLAVKRAVHICIAFREPPDLAPGVIPLVRPWQIKIFEKGDIGLANDWLHAYQKCETRQSFITLCGRVCVCILYRQAI